MPTPEQLAKWLADRLRECEGDWMAGAFVDASNLREVTVDGNFDFVAFAARILDRQEPPETQKSPATPKGEPG